MRRLQAWVVALGLATVAGGVGCRSTAPPPGGVVVAFGSNQLRQLDPAALAQTAQLDLPGPAEGVAVDNTRHQLVALAGHFLLLIRLQSPTILTRVPLAIRPAAIRLDPTGQRAYMVGSDRFGNGLLIAADVSSGRILARLPVGRAPQALTFSSDKKHLLVAAAGTAVIDVISLASWKIQAHIQLNAPPRALATLPYGDKAFALCGSNLAVVDLRRGVLLTYLPIGMQARAMVIKPDGGELYVSNATGTVSVINTSTNEVAATMLAGLGAGALAISPDGSTLYVANADAGTISVISLDDRRTTAVVQVGERPSALALGTDGQYLFAADAASSDVAVIRSNASPSNPNTLVTLLPAPPQPDALVVADLP